MNIEQTNGDPEQNNQHIINDNKFYKHMRILMFLATFSSNNFCYIIMYENLSSDYFKC